MPPKSAKSPAVSKRSARLHPLFRSPEIAKIRNILKEQGKSWVTYNAGQRVEVVFQPDLSGPVDLIAGLPDIFPRGSSLDDAELGLVREALESWLSDKGLTLEFRESVRFFELKIGIESLSLQYTFNGASFSAYCETSGRNLTRLPWLSKTQITTSHPPKPTQTEIVMSGGYDAWLQNYLKNHPIMDSFSPAEIDPAGLTVVPGIAIRVASMTFERPKI